MTSVQTLLDTTDWSATALGSRDTWPLELKSAIGIMLHSSFPMFVSWGSERFFFYNDPYAVILGAKHPSALGARFKDIWREIWNDIGPLVTRVDQGESVYLEDMKLKLNRHGFEEEAYFTFSYSPIISAEGKVAGLFCAVVETTARKRSEEAQLKVQAQLANAIEEAERQRSKFEAAFHAVAEGIFIFDSEGNPVFMNDAAAKVFGSENAADVRKRVEWYFERLDLYDMNDNFIPIAEWPVSKVLRGESFREWHIKAHRKDTNDRWVWSSSGELATQAGSGMTLAVVVLRDITNQKRAELELHAAKEEAERANELKSAFLANMSHEIRTPLGAILGFSTLLKDGSIDSSEKDQYLDTIVRNGNSLTKIIDDILDLAKVEAGRLDIETIPFSLYNLATDVVDIFKDKAREKNIYLLLNIAESVPSQICTDPTRLRQILVNLIGNAVKFTDSGGVRVDVRSTAGDADNLTVTIDVKDTGIGLTEDQSRKLFQPFTQADNSMTRKFGGTGLGLALSQRLSQALSGKISIVESKIGTGSTFRLTFEATCVKTRNLARKDVERVAVASLDGLRVLVVDDSPDNQFLVERVLTKNGATVDTASDGDEGVRKALSNSYDIILMDIQMPKLDGYQAKAALDKSGYNRPVIALTAHAMSEERLRTREAGFAGHLTKPLNGKELVTTLAELV